MNQNIRLRNLKRQYFLNVRPHRLTNAHAGTLRDICKDLSKQKQKLCELNECLPGRRVSVFPSCISRISSLSICFYFGWQPLKVSLSYVLLPLVHFYRSSTSWQAHLCDVSGSLLSFLYKCAGLCHCYVSGSPFIVPTQVGRPRPLFMCSCFNVSELGSIVLLDSDV